MYVFISYLFYLNFSWIDIIFSVDQQINQKFCEDLKMVDKPIQ